MKLYSFPPIAAPDAQVLILGTMPSVKSLQLSQYYGNKANAFWKLMFLICNEPFSLDYNVRKDLLIKNKIAVWDTLQACEREGSLDSAINSEVPNNFEDFFNSHPEIKLIAFNGLSAAAYFHAHGKKPLNVVLVTLPSTSPANASMSFNQKLKAWEIIREV